MFNTPNPNIPENIGSSNNNEAAPEIKISPEIKTTENIETKSSPKIEQIVSRQKEVAQSKITSDLAETAPDKLSLPITEVAIPEIRVKELSAIKIAQQAAKEPFWKAVSSLQVAREKTLQAADDYNLGA